MALLRNVCEVPQPLAAELPLYYGMAPRKALLPHHTELLDPSIINLILHPKSKGSARE